MFGLPRDACFPSDHGDPPTEVVLSTLVSSFQFGLCPEKPIFWNFAGIAYPVTDHALSKPEMTLNVSLASR